MNIKDYPFFESQYAAKWQGIILHRTPRRKCADLCLVLMILDKNGNRIKNRQTVFLDEGYLKPVEAPDMYIYSNWVQINTKEHAEIQRSIDVDIWHNPPGIINRLMAWLRITH